MRQTPDARNFPHAEASAALLPQVRQADMGCVLIAPDKFKGSLAAPEVAAHVARGIEAAVPGVVTDLVPIADGGDGTVDAAVAAGYRRIEVSVRGPAGDPVVAAFGISGDVAVIESAQACGLARLPGGRPLPLTATSYGVGELIAAAAGRGARRIVLGLGGVATTDGGAGLVTALGGRLLDAGGRDIAPGGAALAGLRTLDLTGLRDLSGLEVILASDVDNPLLGPDGAAAVYGPQKGASEADIPVLDAGLARWADVAEAALAGVPQGGAQAAGTARGGAAAGGAAAGGPTGGAAVRFRDQPGAGAAGGLGFAALAFLNARMRPGIDVLLDLVSFGRRVAGASLVITGEGSLDAQTLRGKAPAGVARATRAASPGTPVVAVAGRCSLDAGLLTGSGLAGAYALSDIEPDVAASMANAGPLLEKLAQQVAADWLAPPR
jgi:glycerate kinase